MRSNLKELMEMDFTKEQTSFLIGCLIYIQMDVGSKLLEGKQVESVLRDLALKLSSEIDRRVPIPAK
jgi:hypothetical protein